MKGGRQTCSRPPRVTVATICTGRVWPGLAAPENETPDPEASLSRSQTYIETVVFPVLLFHFVQKREEAGKRLKEGSWLTSPGVERSMSRQSWPTTPSSAWLASMAAWQQGRRLARQVAKCTAMRVSFTQQAREPPPSERAQSTERTGCSTLCTSVRSICKTCRQRFLLLLRSTWLLLSQACASSAFQSW